MPSSCGASQPATVPGAEENTWRLDFYRPTTGRLAADGFRYEWEEFVAYYREDALAMLVRLTLIHWRIFVETSQEYDEFPDISERHGDRVSNDLCDAYGA